MNAAGADGPDPWHSEPSASFGTNEHAPRVPVSGRRATTAVAVPDDWDNDDSDNDAEGIPNLDLNKKIWDEANTKAPMPEVLIKPSAGSSSSTIAPPPAAFQAPMRILKRPTSTSTSTSRPGSSARGTESLKDREARYHAARERIFGPGETPPQDGPITGNSAPSSQKVSRTNTPIPLPDAPSVPIARAPRGPGDGSDGSQVRGFHGRKHAPPPQSSGDSLVSSDFTPSCRLGEPTG